MRYPQLDISSSESIGNLVRESGSVVDVLINNAGVNLDAPGSYGVENVRKTLDVNFRGTVEVGFCFYICSSFSIDDVTVGSGG